MRRRDGFTIIEVLTVIAIIGILAAIIFPILGKVKENGRRARCVTNLKQFGVAYQMFAADNRGFAPSTWLGVRYGGYERGDQVDPLYEYVNRNWETYYCPSDRHREEHMGAPAQGQIRSSYGYNWWGPGNTPPTDPRELRYWKRVRLRDIPSTPGSKTDPRTGKRDWSAYNKIYILDEFSVIAPDEDRDGDGVRDCYQRHGLGCNLLLSDGSVYWCKGYDFEQNQGF
jgi:prepilin-type N-terminal cleavage/methylation domain-containing protein